MAKASGVNVGKKKVVAIPARLTVRDFAAKLGIPVTDVLGVLLKSGILSAQNDPIDFETATIVAQDLGFETTGESAPAEPAPANVVAPADFKNAVPRPPVIVVLGHVDHGKTLLLDAIRKTNVVAGEAGGITQHIGAYQVRLGSGTTPAPQAKGTRKGKGRARTKAEPAAPTTLTFIDTPGHEAFTAMRSRGAKVADLAVLVVAADEGVKPQTVEAITIIKAAGIPYVVAANKMDKPEANLDRLKQALAQHDLAPEDYGGKTVVVPVSAKTGEGMDTLLETLSLLGEVEHGRILADPAAPASGTIIESHLDPGEGPVATVLVQNGTLKVGDLVTVGNTFGKIRALKDDRGTTVREAPPSFPARILGLKAAPVVGDVLCIATDIRDLRKNAKRVTVAAEMKTLTAIAPVATTGETAVVNVVVKADTIGSLEAIAQALRKLVHPEVRIEIVHQGLGGITEADVLRAETSKALLLGFHVAVTPSAQAVASGRDFILTTDTVIYDLVERVRVAMERKLKPEVQEILEGRLKLLAVFRPATGKQIVGGRVEQGAFQTGAKVRITRKEEGIGEGTVLELRQGKTPIKEISSGSEVGLKVDAPVPLAVGDVLERVRTETHTRTLTPA